MNRLLKVIALAILIVGAALRPCFGEEGARYAVVDTQRVINESIIGKAARNNLEAQIKKGQAKLSQAKADFEKQRSDLERQSSILSGQALEEKRETVAKKQVELQRTVQDLQDDLARKNDAEIGQVIEQINLVVKDLAKAKGYTFVFERDKQVVVYASDRVDITPEVVEALDRKKVAL
jgi:outer membrane protein